MNILSIIKLFLSLASSLTQYAHDKKMMDAGAAQSALKGMQDVDEAINRAIADRNAPSLSDESDPNNRRNK